MNTFFQNKNINKKAVVAFIVLQAIFITILFGIRKQGYHSDEVWNYAFANSTTGTQVYITDDNIPTNYLKWSDSKAFLDYISVDKSEIFSYSSIYKNASQDLNPPLQYMLLHFVCSFFPNAWSKWFCFFINIVAFMITQIYLFKFIKDITQNDIVSLAGIILYGLSAGAINTNFFLRIYALGTCFVMMFVYYSFKLFLQRKECPNNSLFIKIFITCFLGSFTIHLFFSIAFIIVLMYSIYYFFSKNYKLFFKYGFTCLSAVLLTLILFPASLYQMFGHTEVIGQKKYPTLWQFKIYWSFMTKDVSGFHNSAINTMTKYYVLLGVFIISFLSIPICFLARKEKWFKKAVTKVKEKIKSLYNNKNKFPYIIIVLIVSINFFIFVAAANSSIPRMGIYARRYLFIIYPLYASLAVIILYYLIKIILSKKKAVNIIMIITALVSVSLTYVFSSDFFSFRHEENGINFDKIEKDANCIILLNNAWLVTSASFELYDTNSFYLATFSDYEQDNYSNNIDTSKPLYLILETTIFPDEDEKNKDNAITVNGGMSLEDFALRADKDIILNYYERLSISSKVELVGKDVLFGRRFEIYRLN